MTDTRQTRKSPTHNRHEIKRGRILPEFSFDGIGHLVLGLRNPSLFVSATGANIGAHFHAHNRAVGRSGGRSGKADSHDLRAFAVFRAVHRVLGNRGQGLGPLRGPTGASPLATKGNFLQDFRKSKIKRSSERGPGLRQLSCGSGGLKRQSPESPGLCLSNRAMSRE
jgi:hypothetical protein